MDPKAEAALDAIMDDAELSKKLYGAITNETKPLGPDSMQMFCDKDETVINWKGENYYKACGSHVRNLPEGGNSSCVLRVGHGGYSHQDYNGVTTKIT